MSVFPTDPCCYCAVSSAGRMRGSAESRKTRWHPSPIGTTTSGSKSTARNVG
jgi:hypothetical protein